jgi:hypothetical protein
VLDTQWLIFSLEIEKFNKSAKIVNQGQKNRPQKCIKKDPILLQNSYLSAHIIG